MTISASTPRIRVTQAWYLLVLILVAFSERSWDTPWLDWTLSLAGLVLMVSAALGRVWTSAFIAGHKDARLVREGPYSLCRHPLYLWSLVGGLGVGFASRSLVITVATLALLAFLYSAAMRAEEMTLLARHGEAFRNYCDEVPRLIPHTLRGTIPRVLEIDVDVYRKAYFDAGAFIALFVLIQILELLRAVGLWHARFVLW